jgi:hypothetical protein
MLGEMSFLLILDDAVSVALASHLLPESSGTVN